MHILYIHQHFAIPSGNAPTRSYEFARRWVKAGHKVTVICGCSIRSGLVLGKRLTQQKNIEGINVIVTHIEYSNKQSFHRRMLSFVCFVFLSTYVGLRIKKADVIYASSTPLTVGVPAIVLKCLKHIPFVFEVRDQWPEVPIELEIIKNKIIIKLLLWLEKIIYRSSAAIVTVSEGMAEGVRQVTRNGKPVYVIPNGADLDLFRSDIDGSIIRQEKRWNDKLVLVQAGAMGKVNGLEFIIDVAQKLTDYYDILFVLIGNGSKKADLKRMVKKFGLKNVEILQSVPRHYLPTILAASDVVVATIGKFPIVEKHASLNKFYDGLSSGKCMLLNYHGWQGELIENNNAGFGCGLCDVDEFVQKVLYLNSHRQELLKLGRNARRIAVERFNRDMLALEALEVISAAAKKM
jgi:glycosyltransferase involved in cell wall biosynthesis